MFGPVGFLVLVSPWLSPMAGGFHSDLIGLLISRVGRRRSKQGISTLGALGQTPTRSSGAIRRQCRRFDDRLGVESAHVGDEVLEVVVRQ